MMRLVGNTRIIECQACKGKAPSRTFLTASRRVLVVVFCPRCDRPPPR